MARLSDAPLVATHSSVHALCPSSRNLTDAQLDAIGETGGLVGVNFMSVSCGQMGRIILDTPLSDIVQHIEYITERIGIEHVAFGSDFDGANMPRELGDVAGLPKLVAALRSRGYGRLSWPKSHIRTWLRIFRVRPGSRAFAEDAA